MNTMSRMIAGPMSVAAWVFLVRIVAAQAVPSGAAQSTTAVPAGPKAATSASPGTSLGVTSPVTPAVTPTSGAASGATPQTKTARTSTSSEVAGAPPAGAPAPPPSAAESAAAAATTSPVPVNDEAVDAGTYGVRLRDLEQRINELKEQIFRSKARLSLLAETVLQGVVAGSQARLIHENKMGNSYKLVKAVYALDGAPIFNKADEEGGLGDEEEFDVYNGSIVPGEHTLTIKLEYRGHGYGIFSYLKGYRFKVSSSHTFTAPEGKALNLRVVGYEKGGPTAPLEERPAVRFVERVSAVVAGGAAAGAGGE